MIDPHPPAASLPPPKPMLSPASAPGRSVPAKGLASALATTTTIQILSTATALVLTGIAPLVARDFGLAPHWVGYQISVIYASGMIASAMAGAMIVRFGPVRIEQLALLCYALALLLLTTGNAWIAGLASLVIGVGYGVQNPASAQILGKVTPPARRALIFSIKQAGVPLGGVIASLAYPALAPVIGWRMALALTAVPCLAMIAVLTSHGDGPRGPASRAGGSMVGRLAGSFLYEQRLVWGHASLRVLALLGMLYSSLQLSLSAFTVSMLVDHGWPLVAAGMVAGVVQACGAVGRISWGLVGDRIGGFRVLCAIGLIAMACMVALWRLDAMPAAVQIAVLGLFGFCMSGWNGVLMAECTRHCQPRDAGRVIGGALVYTFLGVMIGPAVAALVYEACGDYGTTFLLMSWVAGLGAVMAGWMAWSDRAAASKT
ncbi:MFS transporter [Novosphingobium rhizosphaerae]|uniref:MFS transporter n=1 Tax=Novosphingobium rhizosphaerae TaxID=1551649 RepID=UPI00180EA81C